jgi:carbon-monoxide dehydrogenase iron sulfur subunit
MAYGSCYGVKPIGHKRKLLYLPHSERESNQGGVSMKVLVLEPAKCTGCRACMDACSFEKTGVFNPLDSRVNVIEFREDLMFVPTVCSQCEMPYCAQVCPTTALVKNTTTGLVDFLKEKCIGCKQCVVACPWGSIRINHLGKEIIKCDHCSGDPACVKVCKPEALTYVEVEDVVSSKQHGVAQTYRRIAAEMAKGVNP